MRGSATYEGASNGLKVIIVQHLFVELAINWTLPRLSFKSNLALRRLLSIDLCQWPTILIEVRSLVLATLLKCSLTHMEDGPSIVQAKREMRILVTRSRVPSFIAIIKVTHLEPRESAVVSSTLVSWKRKKSHF